MANTPDINTSRYAFWGDSASELATLVAAKAAGITAATLLGSAPYVPQQPTVAITYNADGTVATLVENGFTSTFTYNADATVHTVVRAGVTRTYSYNADGTISGVA